MTNETTRSTGKSRKTPKARKTRGAPAPSSPMSDKPRASAEQYRSLFESIDEGFCLIEALYDEHGRLADFVFREVNPAFERQTGLSNVVGKTVGELLPTFEPYWSEIYARVAQTGESVRMENYVRDVDRWYEVYFARAGADGRLAAAVFNDITKRKRAETRLRESEERLQKALSAETVGVLFFRLDGRITGANAALLRMSGYDEDELLAITDWSILTPPEFSEVTERAAREVAERGKTTPYEKQWIRRDGSRWWGLFAPTRLSGQGSESECVEFIIDITGRKQTENALRESEERFRTLAEAAPQIVWMSDEEQVGYFNECWYAYTRRTPETSLGTQWSEAVHPDDRSEALRRLAHANGAGELCEIEYRLRRHDGAYRWHLARAICMAGTHRWIGIAVDVHQQRTAREELAAQVMAATSQLHTLSQRLLQAHEAERRHLARELHDEIGQALTVLQLELAKIRQDAEGEVASALTDAEATLRDLMTRVSELSMDLRPAILDTLGLAPALLWYVERYQARTGIGVDLRLQGLERRFFPAIEITAYRIVQEALTNIARHAQTQSASVHLLAEADLLTIMIGDEGQGFGPHTAADGGLGGMRERVSLVGGALEIETAPGHGTVITAEIPYATTARDEGEGNAWSPLAR
jgi:PAS domain S-box-containing protein